MELSQGVGVPAVRGGSVPITVDFAGGTVAAQGGWQEPALMAPEPALVALWYIETKGWRPPRVT